MRFIFLCTVMALTLGDLTLAEKPMTASKEDPPSKSVDETDSDEQSRGSDGSTLPLDRINFLGEHDFTNLFKNDGKHLGDFFSKENKDLSDLFAGGRLNLKELLQKGDKYGSGGRWPGKGQQREKPKTDEWEDGTGSGDSLEEATGMMDIFDGMFDTSKPMKAVKIDEVKVLLGQMSTLVKEVDNPLEALKSELVDKMSQINDDQELARFLGDVQKRHKLPSTAFKRTIKSMAEMIMRLFETEYETDTACVNLQRRMEEDMPKTGKLPDDFRSTFLSTYLMSVSCLARDNALFHKDLPMLQELHESSGRDEVVAAVSKVMVGSLRLLKTMTEQEEAVQEVFSRLPEPGIPEDTVIYRRLVNGLTDLKN